MNFQLTKFAEISEWESGLCLDVSPYLSAWESFPQLNHSMH